MEEFPVFPKAWRRGMYKVAVVFPNLYYGGVYALGLLVVYNVVNQRPGWVCERRFLDVPDLKGFDLVGFSVQYELDYFNVVRLLQQNGIPLHREGRDEVVFAGGPCVSVNPETLAGYMDFVLVGECEESLPRVLEVYEEGLSKGAFLERISRIPGVFVPGVSGEATYGRADLETVPFPVYQPLPVALDKRFVFGEAFVVEVERSCPYQCRFCSLPRMYAGVQYPSLGRLQAVIKGGARVNRRRKVVVYSPSLTHPQRRELLFFLAEEGFSFSLPSLRVEYVDAELLQLMRVGGQRSLTVAPEADERVRFLTGKRVLDEVFFTFLRDARRSGFGKVKLYVQVGLPGQEERDVEALARFVLRCRGVFQGLVYVSVNPFVPKPKTEFAGHVFDKVVVRRQVEVLRRGLQGKVRVKLVDVETSLWEWRLAHARSLGPFLRRGESVVDHGVVL